MKRMEHETLKHAIMVVADLYKAAGVSVFKKVLIPVQSIFSFKAKAFSFCLFCYPSHRHSFTRHDNFASDIETCKHVSASLGSIVILRGEASKNPVTFSPGSFDFVLRITLKMTPWESRVFKQ